MNKEMTQYMDYLFSAALKKTGDIAEKMMYNTYNMGIGMMLAVDAKDADKTIAALKQAGEQAYVTGRIEAGEKGVELI